MILEEKGKHYYTEQRPEMVDFLPQTIKRTIEFGCSNGNFSSTVKKIFNAEVWGVDLSPEAIVSAEKVLDHAICGDAIESLKKLPKNYFDCVICNDFLEHIPNPADFLKALKPYLTDSAILVCSLPNVRYWKNIREVLFEKDWRYRDAGILDNTHLRFFTKKSMIRLMNECDLTVEEIKGLSPTKSLRFPVINLLTLWLHNDMKYLQYGIRAKFN